MKDRRNQRNWKEDVTNLENHKEDKNMKLKIKKIMLGLLIASLTLTACGKDRETKEDTKQEQKINKEVEEKKKVLDQEKEKLEEKKKELEKNKDNVNKTLKENNKISKINKDGNLVVEEQKEDGTSIIKTYDSKNNSVTVQTLTKNGSKKVETIKMEEKDKSFSEKKKQEIEKVVEKKQEEKKKEIKTLEKKIEEKKKEIKRVEEDKKVVVEEKKTDTKKPETKKPETKKPENKKTETKKQDKIEEKMVNKTQTIPYKTRQENDPNLEKGKTRSEGGVNGEKVLRYRVTFKNGVAIEENLLSATVTKKPVDKINYVGTKVVQTEKPRDEKPRDEKPADKITYKETTKTETIAFNTRQENDPELKKGKTRVQEGSNGVKTIYIKEKYVNGRYISSETVRTEITKQPVDKITFIGTRESKWVVTKPAWTEEKWVEDKNDPMYEVENFYEVYWYGEDEDAGKRMMNNTPLKTFRYNTAEEAHQKYLDLPGGSRWASASEKTFVGYYKKLVKIEHPEEGYWD